jgi:hypothetical protein
VDAVLEVRVGSFSNSLDDDVLHMLQIFDRWDQVTRYRLLGMIQEGFGFPWCVLYGCGVL